jgi:sulfate permease, SulP family
VTPGSEHGLGGSADPGRPAGLARFLPIISWLPAYQRSWLRRDIVGGLSVWAVTVPMSLGYAKITGVPVQYGLYAAMAGLIAFAIFTTSRQVTEGPSSVTAPVVGAGVLAVAAEGSDDAVAFAAATVIVGGLLFLALYLLKMGWIADFMSASVLTGFMFGVAINVAVGQLFSVTGTQSSGANTWQKLSAWLSSLPEANTATVAVGVAALVLIFGLRSVSPRIPGGLVAVAAGIVATLLFDLGDQGVQLTADVPGGLPSFVLPDLAFVADNLDLIVGTAAGAMLIGLSVSMAAVREYASRHNYRIDANQELLAQAMSNLSSGVVQGIFNDGSLSRTPINEQAGARSQLSNLFQAALVLLTLLVLAPLFSLLPQAVLAAVIIAAVVVGMMNVPEMKRLVQVNRAEFVVAVAALVGVLTFGVLQGIVIGIGLSLIWLVHATYRPTITRLGRAPGTDAYVDLAEQPSAETSPDLVILRFDGGLYFANSGVLGDHLREIRVQTAGRLTGVILTLEGVDFIDIEGADTLKKIVQAGHAMGIDVRLVRVKAHVLDLLERDGVVGLIGAERLHRNVAEAVQAHRDTHRAR